MARIMSVACSCFMVLIVVTLAEDAGSLSCSMNDGASCSMHGSSLIQRKSLTGKQNNGAFHEEEKEEEEEEDKEMLTPDRISSLKTQLFAASADQKKGLLRELDLLYGRLESELEHTSEGIAMLEEQMSSGEPGVEQTKLASKLEESKLLYDSLTKSLPSSDDEVALMEYEVDEDDVEADDDQDVKSSHRHPSLAALTERLQFKLHAAGGGAVQKEETIAMLQAEHQELLLQVENKLEEISVKIGTLQNKLALQNVDDKARARINTAIDKLEARSATLVELLPEDEE